MNTIGLDTHVADVIAGAIRALRATRSCWLAAVLASLLGSAAAEPPEVIARVKRSVAMVGTFKSLDSPRFRLRGAGFVVGDGNQVVTNAHVVFNGAEANPDSSLVVQIWSAERGFQLRQATVLKVDKLHDLVLMRFEGAAAPALVIRDSTGVREGQSVAFTGFPIGGALGYSPVTHRGMVSSITASVVPTPTARMLNESTIRGARAGSFDIFQLDATAYPGNSGGPLFDPDNGEVLGVVNMVFIKGTRESALSQPSGITYAIPSQFIVELLGQAGPSR